MAKETNLTGDDGYWLGTDFSYAYHIKNEAEDTSIDITGYALSWMVKRNASDADADALVTYTTASGITIAGTFNATPASNTQRATVAVVDTDTHNLPPGLYRYELKRTDAGAETILAFGPIQCKQGVHR